jgi:hypothetical protein
MTCMRIIQNAAFATAATSLFVTPAAAAPRQPTGPWVVDSNNDQCFLDRNYGTDASPVLLAIRRVPMDPDIAVGVYRRSGHSDPTNGNAKVGFGAAAPVAAKFRSYSIATKNLHNFTAYIPNGAPLLDAAAQSGVITVQAPGELDEAFAVPELAAGLKALDGCMAELGSSWGISAEQQKRVKELPRALRPDYVSPADYSPQEINQIMNAPALVRLWVDESGKPLDCVPLKSNGAAEDFAQTTCRVLLKRAAFAPAMDVDGKPIKGIVVYKVDFVGG